MEFDRKTTKLAIAFFVVNIIAAVVGAFGIVLLGIVPGLIIFAVVLVLAAVGLQYWHLGRETED